MAKTLTKKYNIVVICFLAAIAGLLFGMDTGVISGALPFLSKEFQLTAQAEGQVVSALMFGGAVGAILAGWLSWNIGRKYSLVIAAILFVAGSLICAVTPNVTVLVFARVILGLAVGIASFATPLYLSEVAPERIRGSMGTFYQLLITIGILAAFLSDTAFSQAEAWRWMLGIVALPAAVLLIALLFLPRSPRWLAAKGRTKQAEEVLQSIRGPEDNVEKELDEIQDSLRIKQYGFPLFKKNKNFRRSVGLGVLLQIMQQFTGINIVLYYAPKIAEVAGFASTAEKMWTMVIIGLVNVLATFIAVGIIDRWGRRPTLLVGFVVMAIGMGVLSLMLSIGSTNPFAQYFTILMVLVFIIGFAMSAGPLIWVLCSEIQPLNGRDFGITVSTATNWFANMLIAYTFLPLLTWMGPALAFLVYTILNVIFIGFTLWFVPETKNISLEHIEANLMAGKKLRDIGQPVSTH